MTEHRTFRNVEIRATDETGPNGRPVVTLRAITPGVVDDYGSLWNPATFDARMAQRTKADPDDTPSLCWAHDWGDPIAHGVGFRGTTDGPDIDFELDDFDAVPRAKQANAQVRSKTIRDCSVGFSHAQRREPTEAETRAHPGIKEVIEEADLDEVSLVLRGAVPGAKVLAVRSATRGEAMSDMEFVVELGRKIASKEITHEEAEAALWLASGEAPPEPVVEEVPEAPDLSDVLAEADELLDA